MYISITKTTHPGTLLPSDQLGFGIHYTDHMFIMDYSDEKGWYDPRIVPFQNISLSPAACVFHYGAEVFEGLKAYRRPDGEVQLFRPWDNMERMKNSAIRLGLPVVPPEDALEAVKALVKVDERWVPSDPGTSLYIRPFLYGTDAKLGLHGVHTAQFIIILSPVGSYFDNGMEPVKIIVETEDVRAVRGGTGEAKCGGNYGASNRAGERAFANGYSSVKLYFMMGLPTETMEDIEGIAETAQKVVDLYYSLPKRGKGKGVQVTISCACFVPKPHTPFQFVPMDTAETLQAKQKHLLESVHSRKIKVNYHDSTTSFLEGVFAKGDRRLAPVIVEAYKRGCYFDGWEECFKYDTWMQTFADLGIDPAFYCQRPIALDEVTPWSHMDYGITHEYLVREYNKALAAQTTPPCNRACNACGANHLLGGPCFDYSQNLV